MGNYFYDYYESDRTFKNNINRRDDYKFSSPICNFFKKLTSGDNIDTLIIGGKNHSVDAFVGFDENTGVITFVKDDGAVFIVGCDRLDAVIIDDRDC
ncbi:hypothetical protein IGM_02232 [Bacillus cereus HuB4-4]|uniref:Uncharacterized protein n=1 Tax=Bacillus cereus HuB4-4 TaxID=1053211 RepID=A0A9W5VMG4_BACCE|nr:hypothetical protein [Bacillus cereus]EOP90043.1 hypothetical protein IGM_02232 [Bacillus cereus HuB4-4]